MTASASSQPSADLPETELLANLLLFRPRHSAARSAALAVISRANIGRLMAGKSDDSSGAAAGEDGNGRAGD